MKESPPGEDILRLFLDTDGRWTADGGVLPSKETLITMIIYQNLPTPILEYRIYYRLFDPRNPDLVSPDCLKQIDILCVLWRARNYPFITEQDTEREVFSLQTLSDVSQFSLIQIKYPGPKHSLPGPLHQPIRGQHCVTWSLSANHSSGMLPSDQSHVMSCLCLLIWLLLLQGGN